MGDETLNSVLRNVINEVSRLLAILQARIPSRVQLADRLNGCSVSQRRL
jgi:hypothetical protein